MEVLWENRQLSFMDRAAAEQDPTFKQLIPYCVFKNQAGEVFSYERTAKGGETRLHGYKSIGVGGHVNPIDGTMALDRSYIAALAREIKEETNLDPTDYDERIIAVVNDDSNSVGQVHFGCVHLVQLTKNAIENIRLEKALANGQWLTVDKLKEDVDNYESWSQLIIRSKVL